MLLGKSRGQLLIAPERMKWLGPSGSDSQLWMCLVVKVKCKEQYCIRTWNVRSMNQGKMDMVKQDMARLSIDILGISGLKWTGMDEFNSYDHYIYYCGQECHGRNGVALIVNKRVQNAVQFSSVQFTHSAMSDSLRPHESQHTRPPCSSPTPRVHSDSRPSSQ